MPEPMFRHASVHQKSRPFAGAVAWSSRSWTSDYTVAVALLWWHRETFMFIIPTYSGSKYVTTVLLIFNFYSLPETPFEADSIVARFPPANRSASAWRDLQGVSPWLSWTLVITQVRTTAKKRNRLTPARAEELVRLPEVMHASGHFVNCSVGSMKKRYMPYYAGSAHLILIERLLTHFESIPA